MQMLFDVFLPSVAKAADAQSRQREPESPRCNELFSSHPVSTAHMVRMNVTTDVYAPQASYLHGLQIDDKQHLLCCVPPPCCAFV